MKKFVVILTVLICLIAFLSCCTSSDSGDSVANGEPFFNALVLELQQDSLKVQCTDSFSSGISVGEEVWVAADGQLPEKLAVDDQIRVVFNGVILESYPLQLGKVFAVYLLDEDGQVIDNQ